MLGYYVKLPGGIAKSVGVHVGDIVMVSSRRACSYAWVRSIGEDKIVVSLDLYLTLGAPEENVLLTPVRQISRAEEVRISVDYPELLGGDALRAIFRMLKSLRLVVSRGLTSMIYVPSSKSWIKVSFDEVKPYGPALITEFTKIVLR